MPDLSNATVALTPHQELQARLADPRTVESLNRLLDRLDIVSSTIDMFTGFLERGPELADNISEGVEELRGQETIHATDLIGKLPALANAGARMADVANSPSFDRLIESGLLEKLTDPRTMENLSLLLEKLDLVAFTVKALDEFLRRGDAVADSISDSIGDLRNLVSSVDTNQIKVLTTELPQLVEAGRQLIASGLLSRMSELTEAGMLLSKAGFFDPKTVTPLAEMGQLAAESYVAAKAAPPQKQYGVFDLMKLLKEPGVQKSIQIMVEMSRQFGRKIA